ncbi:hypothetical protein [Streptomyces anthocyanicus]|uniref:hypothetical protein n=1 Tax=Streptomyces anthocyanicus TaxID=68174 RepID=UPI0038632D0C|nr:DUF5324 family protein [Streptomyces anthocyanicus]
MEDQPLLFQGPEDAPQRIEQAAGHVPSDEDRAQIQQAVQVVRRIRQVGSLGLPRVRQPLPDLRPTRSPDMSKGPFNLT